MIKKMSSLNISLTLHGLVVLGYIILKFNFGSFLISQKVPIEVIQYPQVASAQLKLQPIKTQAEEKKPEPIVKKVFGVSRNAITTTEPTANTPEVKQGNTIAKQNDDLKLEKDDPDSIPIPTDDYLVSSQVALLRDVKIPYPPEAKKANIEGPVVMDLVIDQNGNVRSVELIRGPGAGLNEAALEAIKSFLFRPAKVGDQNVAVKIRYTYRFILENR